jgi:hypothetical protein
VTIGVTYLAFLTNFVPESEVFKLARRMKSGAAFEPAYCADWSRNREAGGACARLFQQVCDSSLLRPGVEDAVVM